MKINVQPNFNIKFIRCYNQLHRPPNFYTSENGSIYASDRFISVELKIKGSINITLYTTKGLR